MRKLFMILGFTLVGSLVLAQSELTVITCNTMGMKPETRWQDRIQMQIDQLSVLKPDFILLQEVCETVDGGGDDNMARTLAAGLSGITGYDYAYYFSPTDISWGEFQEGIAIVSCHPILQYGYRELTPGALKRKVIWVQADTEAGLVNVFCTHLSYRDDHEHIRVKQVEEIQSFVVATNEEHPAEATVIGGDFNCIPGSVPLSAMIDSKSSSTFIDCYAVKHPDIDGFTFPSDHPEKRVDYIFIPADSSLFPVSAITVLDQATGDGLYPSDHLSVLVRFEIKH